MKNQSRTSWLIGAVILIVGGIYFVATSAAVFAVAAVGFAIAGFTTARPSTASSLGR